MTTVVTKLNVSPGEEGTIKITASFVDEDGTEATPKTLTKTLVDAAGSVMNELDNVAVESGLASEMTFILSGDDLEIVSSSKTKRWFIIRWTYDSDNGTDLNGIDACTFDIINILSIT